MSLFENLKYAIQLLGFFISFVSSFIIYAGFTTSAYGQAIFGIIMFIIGMIIFCKFIPKDDKK